MPSTPPSPPRSGRCSRIQSVPEFGNGAPRGRAPPHGTELGTSRGMDVRTLMQPDPLTLAVTEKLDIADDLMRLGRIRHLPVVDGSRLVGIVSQRDLLRAAV